jgi:hypothetical protein
VQGHLPEHDSATHRNGSYEELLPERQIHLEFYFGVKPGNENVIEVPQKDIRDEVSDDKPD